MARKCSINRHLESFKWENHLGRILQAVDRSHLRLQQNCLPKTQTLKTTCHAKVTADNSKSRSWLPTTPQFVKSDSPYWWYCIWACLKVRNYYYYDLWSFSSPEWQFYVPPPIVDSVSRSIPVRLPINLNIGPAKNHGHLIMLFPNETEHLMAILWLSRPSMGFHQGHRWDSTSTV